MRAAKPWLPFRRNRAIDRIFSFCEDFFVRIISRKKIRNAIEIRPEGEASLSAWYNLAKNEDWSHFPDVKPTWRNADNVGTCVVFDISHNRCRLVAWINYRGKKIFIRHILSHAEYDGERWKHDCDCD